MMKGRAIGGLGSNAEIEDALLRLTGCFRVGGDNQPLKAE
jgi:hypothetical protein